MRCSVSCWSNHVVDAPRRAEWRETGRQKPCNLIVNRAYGMCVQVLLSSKNFTAFHQALTLLGATEVTAKIPDAVEFPNR